MYILEKKEECCGCSACANICPKKCINMKTDKEGFNYPEINQEDCIECGRCRQVCPIINSKNDEESYKKVYAVKNKQGKVRQVSTSGGVFSPLAMSTLNKNGAVFGVELDKDMNIKHTYTKNAKEIIKYNGSKYVQSSLDETYNQICDLLSKNEYVLFSGTPCQNVAIKRYLDIKKINRNKLITCDFICHGVPTPKIFKEHINFLMQKYNKKVVDYKFRTKDFGWKGHFEKAIFEDGTILNKGKYIDVYKQLYGSLNIIRPSCYKCPFANSNHESDITLGDFWGIEKDSEFNDNKGISFVMINTKKGQKILDGISQELDIIEKNIDECVNPQLKKPTNKPKTRDLFWKEYEEKGYISIAKKYTTFGLKKRLRVNVYRLLKKFNVI